MHGSRKTFVARFADAVDLAIDFATLGEYGLEPAPDQDRPCTEQGRWHHDPSARLPRPGPADQLAAGL